MVVSRWPRFIVFTVCGLALVGWFGTPARADGFRISLGFSTGDYCPVGPVVIQPVPVVPYHSNTVSVVTVPHARLGGGWGPSRPAYSPDPYWYGGSVPLGWSVGRHYGFGRHRNYAHRRYRPFYSRPSFSIGFSFGHCYP